MTKASRLAPLPIILIILSFLCPTELSLDISGLRLPPHRVALLVLLPVAFFKLAFGRDQRLRSFDLVFLAYGVWTLAVYSLHMGSAGFIYGGSLALEALGGYFVARAYVRSAEELRATMRAFVAAVVVAALIALPETLLGKIYVHEFLRQLTGYHHPISVESRLGFTRAYGTFDHPIHYGTFCAALLALFWFAEGRARSRYLNACAMGFATFLGLSSAPMLCLGLQGGMLLWERLTRAVRSRLTLTLGALALVYAALAVLSTRGPVALIATGLTLDPWTGFYRLQIWDSGLKNVWSSPIIGIGLAEWSRPWWMISDTIDAFWLVITMRQGIPAFLLLATAITLLMRAVLQRRHRHVDGSATRIAIGWCMTVIALSLVGATVHYWNVLHAFFFFVLGLSGWIADPSRKAAASFAIRQGPDAMVESRSRGTGRPAAILGQPYPAAASVALHGRPYSAAMPVRALQAG